MPNLFYENNRPGSAGDQEETFEGVNKNNCFISIFVC